VAIEKESLFDLACTTLNVLISLPAPSQVHALCQIEERVIKKLDTAFVEVFSVQGHGVTTERPASKPIRIHVYIQSDIDEIAEGLSKSNMKDSLTDP
jgi:hypothetical protein